MSEVNGIAGLTNRNDHFAGWDQTCCFKLSTASSPASFNLIRLSLDGRLCHSEAAILLRVMAC